ncbi:MAG: hypothetical protein HY908_24795, partial [Myxococcales bacterium]|nr:hypothetical protein [Myxococcales bacterium]
AASSAPSAPAAPAPGVFDVHEWGLVDVGPSGARLLAGPPSGPTNWYAPRRKPVLYFHLAEGTPALEASVTVTTARPGFVEHFPAGALSADGATLAWTGLRVRPEACRVSGAPTRDAPECRTPDGLCEAAELARYEAADAACIERAGAAFNHLFYRASGPPPELPYEVSVRGSDLAITHARASDLVGAIHYVHNDAGVVTVATIAPPALGESVTAAPPTGTDVGEVRRALDAAMRQVGLTAAEVAAFDRAWANDLFGPEAARELPARRAAAAPEDYLLFVMPASLVDGASRVQVVPAPRAVRRFLLVRLRV